MYECVNMCVRTVHLRMKPSPLSDNHPAASQATCGAGSAVVLPPPLSTSALPTHALPKANNEVPNAKDLPVPSTPSGQPQDPVITWPPAAARGLDAPICTQTSS